MHSKPLHFLLRYSDNISGHETVLEHAKILEKHGAVLIGKFGVGASASVLTKGVDDLKNGQKMRLYLMSGSNITHQCNVTSILFRERAKDQIMPKEQKLIPAYYRGKPCSLWFKLDSIIEADHLPSDVVLYNEPALKPSSKGMRGLVYLTKATNINDIKPSKPIKKMKAQKTELKNGSQPFDEKAEAETFALHNLGLFE